MKLVIAAEIFPPDIGGPATYSKRLAEALIARGWDVSLVCYSDKKHSDDPAYVYRVLRSKFKPLHYINYYRTLKRLAKDCDVIYAQGPVGSGRPALRVAKELKKKLIVKVVGDYAWERARTMGVTDISIDEFQTKTFSGKIGMLQKIEREVCHGADRVIVPSRYLKKIVMGWGIDEKKIEVIYNAVDFKAIDPTPRLYNSERWLVTVARLVPWKGIDTLIELMPNLIKRFPNLKLKIIGSGPDKHKLQALVDSKSLGKSVEIFGAKSYDDTLAFIHAADLVILNSGYEGLSHVLVEALAFNTSVLASRVGGNPEIVIPGQTGELFEYNNVNEIEEKIINFFKVGNSVNDIDLVRSREREKFFNQFSFSHMIESTTNVLMNL